MSLRRLAFLACLLLPTSAWADGPADNRPDQVRQVPKPGIEVPADDRQALEGQLDRLGELLDRLDASDPTIKALMPDVQIFHKAVHDALKYQEFFAPIDITKAKALLREGITRISQLREGKAPWTTQKGLVVRGYVSKIDGSVQPYGLVVPESYTAETAGRYRLDVWFHGRSETLSEVNFLDEHRRSSGTFTPADTIVLHPYGRFCNAFRFAGEVDVLEAINDVKRNYRIDNDRISARGFSMGGAACWQFAVHYADHWFAANPGAGFAETAKFLKVFQNETLAPTWYEQTLWHLYDSTDVAANLLQCPTVAYSGELDGQKQAADVMAEALKTHSIELTHIIGPGTKHSYEPGAKREVARLMDTIAEQGRVRMPRTVDFTTYSLKYNTMNWVTVDALGAHWTQANVRARLDGPSNVSVTTKNVTALTLRMPSGSSPFDLTKPVAVTIDGKTIKAPKPWTDRSWQCVLHREGDSWELGGPNSDAPRKRHNLQGPIDDAFMDSFLFVRPTSKSHDERVQTWVNQELDRAITRWRRQFRGEARVVDDTAVTPAQIASSNLVLWGDPESNAVLKQIADRLPITWKPDQIQAGDQSFPSEGHALILIAPNPLNPERYVVLNSGFTYREYDDLNNARQVPRLPDWAVIDLSTPPGPRFPGKVVAADFFNESWGLRPAHVPTETKKD
ncbi:MAG: prolyl oligopeptidase family serine peptidase [Isosphaeraceae bacterium]